MEPFMKEGMGIWELFRTPEDDWVARARAVIDAHQSTIKAPDDASLSNEVTIVTTLLDLKRASLGNFGQFKRSMEVTVAALWGVCVYFMLCVNAMHAAMQACMYVWVKVWSLHEICVGHVPARAHSHPQLMLCVCRSILRDSTTFLTAASKWLCSCRTSSRSTCILKTIV